MTGLKGSCPNWTCRPSEFRARGPIGALAAFTKTVSATATSKELAAESGDGGPAEVGDGNCEGALT